MFPRNVVDVYPLGREGEVEANAGKPDVGMIDFGCGISEFGFIVDPLVPPLRVQIRNPKSKIRNAFTLVEMLVAVAMVVIMMTLFATIFQMATGAMAKQKGLSENDQRVRLVMTMLRNDLRTSQSDPVYGGPAQHRTFRLLIPYAAGETTPPINPLTGVEAKLAADRASYFHISEGNPFNDTDDILQLTIEIPLSSNDRIFGRAAGLLPDSTNTNYGDPTANPAVGALPTLPALAPPRELLAQSAGIRRPARLPEQGRKLDRRRGVLFPAERDALSPRHADSSPERFVTAG